MVKNNEIKDRENPREQILAFLNKNLFNIWIRKVFIFFKYILGQI